MHRWCFDIVIDFDTNALMRVLQPFAVFGLRPQWLLLCDQHDVFALTACYDDLDDDIATRLLARLQTMPCVRSVSGRIASLPPGE